MGRNFLTPTKGYVFIDLFRERGRERKKNNNNINMRENIHQLIPVCTTPWDRIHNLGMFPEHFWHNWDNAPTS